MINNSLTLSLPAFSILLPTEYINLHFVPLKLSQTRLHTWIVLAQVITLSQSELKKIEVGKIMIKSKVMLTIVDITFFSELTLDSAIQLLFVICVLENHCTTCPVH